MSKHKKIENQLGDPNTSVAKSGLSEHNGVKSLEINKEQPTENGEFTELEKSRMDSPPKHREENGSEKDEDVVREQSNQSEGA